MAPVVANQPDTDSIADDWQDITNATTDDTFSFVSLSISEDSQDEDDGASKSKTLSLSPRNADATKDPTKSSPTWTSDEESEGEEDLECLGDVDNAEGKTKSAAMPESTWSSTASMNQILDADWNPPYLLKVTTSLGKLIGEIMSAISFHGNFSPLEGTKELRSECGRVRDALKTLEPIVEGYSKHWDTHQTSDLPLDPGLYEWMSNLRIELLGLQRLLQRHIGEAHSASSADDASWGISKYKSSLVESNAAISGFIPILQADYDEFHAANLHMAPTNGSPAAGQYETHWGPGNDASVSRLRRELYDLKDEIDSSQSEFSALVQRQAAAVDLETLQSLARSYALIKAGLGTMLSNHASEWLDYSMAGGITYHEFCQLNPDTIRSLILQLRDVRNSLDSERRSLMARYMYDPDLILDGPYVEDKERDVQTLIAIQDTLCSLLRIKPPSQERAPAEPEN
ncbi:hypothetical protein PG994_009464 [Apiospora phragmitis]|uniref:Uncharacterized protein n=1 Tax=Apiospora phragmitis TaxID=2905665 RepID=A0ABR1ULP7_9PEZI